MKKSIICITVLTHNKKNSNSAAKHVDATNHYFGQIDSANRGEFLLIADSIKFMAIAAAQAKKDGNEDAHYAYERAMTDSLRKLCKNIGQTSLDISLNNAIGKGTLEGIEITTFNS